jgi:two-component system response regulator PilR (NtrC family)
MSEQSVLVIDDEPDICELLSITLARMGLRCDTATSVKQGIAYIEQNNYSLVLSDMRLLDGDGIEIVRYVQRKKPQTPVAVITAYGNVEDAVSTLKAGAFDYISKPVDLKILKELIHTAISLQNEKEFNQDELIGTSPVMKALRQNIYKLSRSQAPVFIQGESGVGKELVARLIHANGPRKNKPFIPVNCGAIPTELMESEFFGYKKGSFTGAVADKMGLFVAAQGGTLFLDEIAELPVAMQVKLLRAIQEKAIKPIGALYETPVDVRILSASHKNLLKAVNEGSFRQDLYYRINVIELLVPTLKERKEDIPELARAILHKLAASQNRHEISLSDECMIELRNYPFRGNIRELENILERAFALCEEDASVLLDLHLPSVEKESLPSTESNLNEAIDERQKEMILDALEKTKWNRTAAARLLGVSFRALRYKLKKLGLDKE